MRVYLLRHERVLFTGDDWLIIEASRQWANNKSLEIYGSHIGCLVEPTEDDEFPEPHTEGDMLIGEICWENKGEAVCGHCGAQVPDSIQCLIKLHTWDR